MRRMAREETVSIHRICKALWLELFMKYFQALLRNHYKYMGFTLHDYPARILFDMLTV